MVREDNNKAKNAVTNDENVCVVGGDKVSVGGSEDTGNGGDDDRDRTTRCRFLGDENGCVNGKEG